MATPLGELVHPLVGQLVHALHDKSEQENPHGVGTAVATASAVDHYDAAHCLFS